MVWVRRSDRVGGGLGYRTQGLSEGEWQGTEFGMRQEPHQTVEELKQVAKEVRQNKGLSYIDINIKSKLMLVMLDLGAMHKFMMTEVTMKFKLYVEKCTGRLNTVNS
ncbi:hypothetical protein Ancab_033769 [Ancistrocladus abbreviatus]